MTRNRNCRRLFKGLVTGGGIFFVLQLSIIPPKIFTPNGDGINDVITFQYLTPGVSIISGRILDLSGASVVDLQPTSNGVLVWDGKDSSGSVVKKGVYIYQIDADGKIYNGAIAVAK